MAGRSIVHLTCAVAAIATYGAAQDARPSPPAGTTAATVALTGCLQADDTGRGFVLRTAAPAASQRAGTGTSATGDAPSGQVTGQTPTGATATETAAPTPAVGTPPASANPASPGYNQPANEQAGVSSAQTPAQAGVTVYRLAGGAGVNLREHAGHTVEIRGTVGLPANGPATYSGLQGPTARSHEPAAKQPGATATGTAGHQSGTSGTDPAAPVPTLTVATIRHLAPSCPQ